MSVIVAYGASVQKRGETTYLYSGSLHCVKLELNCISSVIALKWMRVSE